MVAFTEFAATEENGRMVYLVIITISVYDPMGRVHAESFGMGIATPSGA